MLVGEGVGMRTNLHCRQAGKKALLRFHLRPEAHNTTILTFCRVHVFKLSSLLIFLGMALSSRSPLTSMIYTMSIRHCGFLVGSAHNCPCFLLGCPSANIVKARSQNLICRMWSNIIQHAHLLGVCKRPLNLQNDTKAYKACWSA